MISKLGKFLNEELKIVSINAAPILDFLEKEGMEPPSYNVDHVNSFGTLVEYPIHGWETEYTQKKTIKILDKFLDKYEGATAKQIRKACGVTKEQRAQAKEAVKELFKKKR